MMFKSLLPGTPWHTGLGSGGTCLESSQNTVYRSWKDWACVQFIQWFLLLFYSPNISSTHACHLTCVLWYLHMSNGENQMPMTESWQDGLAGKGICYQALGPVFDS